MSATKRMLDEPPPTFSDYLPKRFLPDVHVVLVQDIKRRGELLPVTTTLCSVYVHAHEVLNVTEILHRMAPKASIYLHPYDGIGAWRWSASDWKKARRGRG